MVKIACITDMDSLGSGYAYLMSPLLKGLAELGHEIKVAGLSYNGHEHGFPFSIIPANDVQDGVAIINNLMFLWKPDIIIVGMDIPLQLQIHNSLAGFKKPYIAITPLENGPLCMTWAAGLMQMNHVFFISELGKQEAIKAGLKNVDHLIVGVDTKSWRPALPEEKKEIRKNLGIGEDEFVILTVADNQERKNLSAAMEIVAKVKQEVPDKKIKYILVTREHSPFGWKLRDLALKLNLNREFTIYERGMSRQNLWGLYAASNVYLQTSKAEGLGLPVLDAMAAGIPVVATDTGAMRELLERGRGHLVEAEFSFTDVWGNSKRDMININEAAKWVIIESTRRDYRPDEVIENNPDIVERAFDYVKDRTWDIPTKQVHDVIEKVLADEPKSNP